MFTNFSNLSPNKKKILITGYLYVLSSLSQLGWLCLTYKNRQETISIKGGNFFNLDTSIAFILYSWVIVHLFYISISLIKIAKESKSTVSISAQDSEKLGNVIRCLTVVTCITVLVVPILLYVPYDYDNVLMFFLGIFGGLMLFTNIKTITTYHKKT